MPGMEKPMRSEHPKRCRCGEEDCPTSGGGFFVLATRGGEEFPIAGPFEAGADALEVLPQAWLFFWKLNPKNPYRWSIVKYLDGPPYPPALLNEPLGVSATPVARSDGHRVEVVG